MAVSFRGPLRKKFLFVPYAGEGTHTGHITKLDENIWASRRTDRFHPKNLDFFMIFLDFLSILAVYRKIR